MHCIGPKYCKKTRGISNPFASKSVGGFTESVLPPSCLYSGQWPYPSVLDALYKKHEPQQKEIKNLLSQKKIQQSLRNAKLPGVTFVSGRGMFSPYPSWLCVFWVKQNQQVKKKKYYFSISEKCYWFFKCWEDWFFKSNVELLAHEGCNLLVSSKTSNSVANEYTHRSQNKSLLSGSGQRFGLKSLSSKMNAQVIQLWCSSPLFQVGASWLLMGELPHFLPHRSLTSWLSLPHVHSISRGLRSQFLLHWASQ